MPLPEPYKEESEDMNTERNCQFCKYYKDGYCENLELKPCYPQNGCEDFSKRNEKSEAEQFAEWVAEEIFSELWEYNKDAFAEIACRKLEKLGIVKTNGDKWELIDPQESEE